VAGGAVPRAPIADKIDRLAGWLKANPEARLWLDGYSDQLGPVAGRFAISQRRAQAVATALQRAGVPRAQLGVRAFGHYLPAEGAGPMPDAQRLVRLHVDGKPDCPEERSNLP
jgi:outer membrane protein OmpA-like peptidoglycan-associated protein